MVIIALVFVRGLPPDKFDELAAYDGSVIVERTKKEGRKDPCTQGLQFTVARGGTADPDDPVAMARVN